MTGEITRKSVLLECLSIMRQELAVCSKHYNGLEPAKGMEEAWEQGRRKVKILEELIHAYDSEPVRKALADWQKEVIEHGPSALKLEDKERDILEGLREINRHGQYEKCGTCARAALMAYKHIKEQRKRIMDCEAQILLQAGWLKAADEMLERKEKRRIELE